MGNTDNAGGDMVVQSIVKESFCVIGKEGSTREAVSYTHLDVYKRQGKKITVFTYKPKKDSKRKLGHRQPYTKVQILSIQA